MSRSHGAVVPGEVDAIQFSSVTLGRKLKYMRESAGLHQSDVAGLARIAPETLSRIENGHGNPTVKLVERIIKAIEHLS